MLKKALVLTAAIAMVMVGMSGNATAASGRDYISIVGSSTVYPFATVVAEQLVKPPVSKPPRSSPPDPAAATSCSAPALASSILTSPTPHGASKNPSEKAMANGVKEIVEVKIGYDGIVVANSKKGRR
jgi:phosphate transport system substrate-binding protein